MEIHIIKNNRRNVLSCVREDGSTTSTDLGPDLPNHDMAHFVVESYFGLKQGFYGMIKSGMTIEELSNKEIIKTLGKESWLAEVLARNLQALGSGSSTIEEFISLVAWETNTMSIQPPEMKLSDVKKIKSSFDELCTQWEKLSDQNRLSLMF
ncbi:hypothetical protein ATO12_00935 [Aquimarina atlantica]|uniref:Uncharacterized protein n=1 Tax=Aquimarina atlantica TaxID=1317122 RepID=A0A023C0G5_9FLAO|nr:hypothetical protein [Aquimarina atlantica]EZH75373.1 hypothetical protein ATO12_00935 [Aquimarina atlantica]